MHFEFFRNGHVLRALERLRRDDVGDHGLKLTRQILVQQCDQRLPGDGVGCVRLAAYNRDFFLALTSARSRPFLRMKLIGSSSGSTLSRK